MEDPKKQRTMDPDDWESFRALAHRMVDDMIDGLRDVSNSPAWQALPADSKAQFDLPLPREGVGAEQVYADFKEHVLPYTNGNRHPRFFGWVQGNGTPLAMMADMLAAGMNPHCAGFEQSSTYVELQVIRWLLEIMGFPADGGGILVSGGTMANFIGVAAARDAQAGFDVWSEGLQSDSARPRLTFYGSEATHGWAPKTANLLGLGVDAFRKVPTTNERIDLAALRESIERDREAGHQPFCVLGTAGSVNTGACDDLTALAELCESEKLWFHVDGAFGAWARLSSTHADLVQGLDRADSLAFDLHKWGYLPFESACALVRNLDAMRRPFAIQGAYIAGSDRGTIGAGIPFADRSIELTRSFKALKVWMSLRAHGIDHLAALIDQNLAQAGELVRLIEESPHLELVAPCPLNVVCFRYVNPGRTEAELNAINTELLLRLQESGFVVPSSTTIDGRFAIRTSITNHRTRWDDLAQITKLAVQLGREIEASP